MKLSTGVKEVERIGVTDNGEKKFSIRASGKAFRVLISGIYSRKIGAIVRELSSNAYDAHVSANRDTTPIEVIPPTRMSPEFVVKDYGIGMSPETLETVYTTFFESTKTDSNDVIGALGLGSKSPLSYANNFTVATRWNGREYTYFIYFNESDEPSFKQVGDQPTTEPNGLTIRIAVQQKDIAEFHTEIVQQLAYFPVKPNTHGVVDIPSPKYALRGDVQQWGLRERGFNGTLNRQGPWVVMGPVAYPLDSSQVPTTISNLNIDLFVDIGTAQVAASRESLSYDPDTIDALTTACEGVGLDIHAKVQAEIDNLPSHIEALEAIYVLNNSHLRSKSKALVALTSVLSQSELNALARQFGQWKYKGVSSPASNIPVSTIGLKSMRIQSVDAGRTLGGATCKMTRFPAFSSIPTSIGGPLAKKDAMVPDASGTISIRHMNYVVIDDRKTGSDSALRYHMDSIVGQHGDVRLIVLVPVDRKTGLDPKEVERVLKEQLTAFPESRILRTAGMETPTTASGGSNKKSKLEFYKWTGFAKKNDGWYNRDQMNRTFSRKCWDVEKFDLNDEHLFVPTSSLAITNGLKVGEDGYVIFEGFDLLLAAAKLTGAIDANATIVGVTMDQYAKLDLSKWKNALDVIRATAPKIMSAVSGAANKKRLETEYQYNGLRTFRKLFPRPTIADLASLDIRFKELDEGYELVNTNRQNISDTLTKDSKLLMEQLKKLVGKAGKMSDPLDSMVGTWSDLVRAYPLLSSARDGDSKACVEYVQALSKFRK